MSNIIKGLKLLENQEKLQNIGSSIVKEAISRAILRKVEAREHKSLVVNKGEFVPVSFRDAFNIKVDKEGRAINNWPLNANEPGEYFEVCYEDAVDGYCDCWADAPPPPIESNISDILQTITLDKLKKNFSAEEVKLLQKYKLIK